MHLAWFADRLLHRSHPPRARYPNPILLCSKCRTAPVSSRLLACWPGRFLFILVLIRNSSWLWLYNCRSFSWGLHRMTIHPSCLFFPPTNPVWHGNLPHNDGKSRRLGGCPFGVERHPLAHTDCCSHFLNAHAAGVRKMSGKKFRLVSTQLEQRMEMQSGFHTPAVISHKKIRDMM